jgi:ABC-type uncharacterized transport system permease subunit
MFLRSVLQLLVTANVPGSLILLTLMMEATHSSETSVLIRATGVTSQMTAFFGIQTGFSALLTMTVCVRL